jgi:hypothetical protein
MASSSIVSLVNIFYISELFLKNIFRFQMMKHFWNTSFLPPKKCFYAKGWLEKRIKNKVEINLFKLTIPFSSAFLLKLKMLHNSKTDR